MSELRFEATIQNRNTANLSAFRLKKQRKPQVKLLIFFIISKL